MDYSTVIVKIVGAALLIWTLYSIYKHFMDHKTKNDTRKNDEKKTSFTEQILNNLLLYLWLAFMVIFSSGMIFNN
jgi:threonine/homoserine/homoserine lactone efflux protein